MGSLLVFNHELMSTTSSMGVHVLRSLHFPGVSSPMFEAWVPWLPKKGTCDDDGETLSVKLPKTTFCWLWRSSTKFAESLNGLKSIFEVKERGDRGERGDKGDRGDRGERTERGDTCEWEETGEREEGTRRRIHLLENELEDTVYKTFKKMKERDFAFNTHNQHVYVTNTHNSHSTHTTNMTWHISNNKQLTTNNALFSISNNLNHTINSIYYGEATITEH